MDPFEMYIDQIFLARMEEAKQLVAEKKKDTPPPNTEQIPFDVNKTMNYIKQDAFLRQRKKKSSAS